MSSSKTNWVEQHRPEEYSQIQGNTSALEDIEAWSEDFTPGDSPVLMVGPPGTGKTTTAYVTAEQHGLDLNEINTSAARRTRDVERMVQQLRAGSNQLVLLDEVDSWPSNVNLTPLYEALQSPSNRVMMTANEKHQVPEELKGPSEVYEFSLSVPSRRAKLKEIAKEEGVPLDADDLERLASRPDLRSAINDLQLASESGVPVGSDSRDWNMGGFEVLDKILQGGEKESGDLTPPDLVMWLDQNARKDAKGLEAGVLYDALSRADGHLGRAKPGDYRPWRYAATLAEHVADLRLSEPYQGYIRWEFPGWYRSKSPDPERDNPEAILYRELKQYEQPGFSMSGSFSHFRRVTLPILRRLPKIERMRMVLDRGLPEECLEALDVDKASYQSWAVDREPQAGEEIDRATGDALEADW